MDEEAELIEKSEAAVVRKTIVKKFTTTVNSEDDDNADEHVIRGLLQLCHTLQNVLWILGARLK